MEKIEKILTKITKTIFNITLILLTIIAIILTYNIIQIRFLGKEHMDILGYSLFQVKTGSMSGTMEIGDIIVVKLTKDVKENDIITFKQEGAIITHRIIEQEGEKITTKGDANNGKDEPITKQNVIGKVVYIFKNVEIWKKVFLKQMVICILFYSYLKQIKNYQISKIL